MSNDILTVTQILSQEDLAHYDLNKKDLEDLIKDALTKQLADLIAKEFEFKRTTLKFKSSRPHEEFRMQVAVLTPERYKQLLRMEQADEYRQAIS